MRVQYLQCFVYASQYGPAVVNKGDVRDVTEEEGLRLIRHNAVRYVGDDVPLTNQGAVDAELKKIQAEAKERLEAAAAEKKAKADAEVAAVAALTNTPLDPLSITAPSARPVTQPKPVAKAAAKPTAKAAAAD